MTFSHIPRPCQAPCWALDVGHAPAAGGREVPGLERAEGQVAAVEQRAAPRGQAEEKHLAGRAASGQRPGPRAAVWVSMGGSQLVVPGPGREGVGLGPRGRGEARGSTRKGGAARPGGAGRLGRGGRCPRTHFAPGPGAAGGRQ